MSGYDTIEVSVTDNVGVITFARPQAGNAIDARMVRECTAALDDIESRVAVIVLKGDAKFFCNGADFAAVVDGNEENRPEPMYALWRRLAHGAFVSVACVEGRANAGGIGFVAACDVVLASDGAEFGLSEMLFGLLPACVMPFLIRRVGHQRARYMTLMTRPFSAAKAAEWGLVDERDANLQALLGRHLARLSRLPKHGIERYKRYIARLDTRLDDCMPDAIAFNHEAFSDPRSLSAIGRFVADGVMPWETPHAQN